MNSLVSEWYAVRTKCRHERKVYESLIRMELDAFFPTIEVLSQRKDRRKKLSVSMFPGYLFAKCVLTDDNWYNINNIIGVAGIVGTVDRATPIPNEQIETISLLLESGLPINPHPYLNEGERVIVTGGPLKGASGIYLMMDNKKGKLIVSIETLGRAVVVEIDPCFVEKY